jgi:hypothetical protein
MANDTTMADASVQFGLPVIDPIISFSTQIVCVAAVVVASSHTVKVGSSASTSLTLPCHTRR